MDDLRIALNNKPNEKALPKARQLLFESLTELFQRNFATNEKYLAEYQDMCKVQIPEGTIPAKRKELEDEQRRRQGNYLCLVAKGREKQENYLEAFKHYEQFGKMGESAGLLTVIDEPTVKARADVWAQGRIRAMFAKATPEKRKPLETEIARRWKAVKGANDLNELRNFVAVFGSQFTVGTQARLELAEKLIDQDAFLEAELQLQQIRRQDDPQVGACAVEMLARLMARKGLMEDAAYWYRLLGHDYEKVTIRDGKTGADFLNDLATDKRFLPYLDVTSSWSGKIEVARGLWPVPADAADLLLRPRRRGPAFLPAQPPLLSNEHRPAQAGRPPDRRGTLDPGPDPAGAAAPPVSHLEPVQSERRPAGALPVLRAGAHGRVQPGRHGLWPRPGQQENPLGAQPPGRRHVPDHAVDAKPAGRPQRHVSR